MIPWNKESVWLDAWPQNKSGSLWPIFHGSVILLYILKAIWCINNIPRNNESVWLDAWPQNKSGSLWPIFHGSVILPYILKAIWCINMIPWNNVSVWLDAWPQNKSGSLRPIFHGSVILHYIFKTWFINMIPWNNESVWLDALTQNKTDSLWPVILAYILKTNLCIRRWHWPGVYVSSCSLALVSFSSFFTFPATGFSFRNEKFSICVDLQSHSDFCWQSHVLLRDQLISHCPGFPFLHRDKTCKEQWRQFEVYTQNGI